MALLTLLQQGDHVVAAGALYGGSVSMLALNLSQWNDLQVIDHERLHDLLARRKIRVGEPIGLEIANSPTRPQWNPASREAIVREATVPMAAPALVRFRSAIAVGSAVSPPPSAPAPPPGSVKLPQAP